MHLNDSELRAMIDHELDESSVARAEQHLATCAACRAQRDELAATAARAAEHLALLAPPPNASIAPARARAAAWRTFQSKIQETPSMNSVFARLRPLWAPLALVTILVVALSFSPIQALASNFLQLFRVQQVTTLSLDMTSLKDVRYDPTVAETITQLFNNQVKVLRPSGALTDVTPAQASQAAGFNVRLPQNAATSVGMDLERLMIQSGPAFEGTFDRAVVQEVLAAFGQPDLELPAGLDGAVARVDIPTGVTAAYGKCKYSKGSTNAPITGGPSLGMAEGCLLLVQMPSPTVDTPPDLPVKQLAEIAMRALGMDAARAAQIANEIDWTTTLVIPVPRGQVNSQTVTVDGAQGVLLTQPYSGEKGSVPSFSLVWTKNGIVYAILGAGDSSRALKLAGSLE